jgi:hypothetical protein
MQSEHSRSDSRGHVSNVAYNCNIKLVLSEKGEESEKEGERERCRIWLLNLFHSF